RDVHVTGVQTCALPISFHEKASRKRGKRRRSVRDTWGWETPRARAVSAWEKPSKKRKRMRRRSQSASCAKAALRAAFSTRRSSPPRSEERRVGKGGDLGGRRSVERTRRADGADGGRD